MNFNKYKNIQLTKEIDNANCITHSGKFHVDDVISTIFLSKLNENIILIRVPTVKNINIEKRSISQESVRNIKHPAFWRRLYISSLVTYLRLIFTLLSSFFINSAIANMQRLKINNTIASTGIAIPKEDSTIRAI